MSVFILVTKTKSMKKKVHYMHRVFMHECKRPICCLVPSGFSVMTSIQQEATICCKSAESLRFAHRNHLLLSVPLCVFPWILQLINLIHFFIQNIIK